MWCILHIDKICKKIETNNKFNKCQTKKKKINFCLSLKFRKYGTFV